MATAAVLEALPERVWVILQLPAAMALPVLGLVAAEVGGDRAVIRTLAVTLLQVRLESQELP